jgi:uncharacterized membrane protein HdeD (DUF308 family)
MDTPTLSMAHTLSRHWWVVLLRGVVAITFGIAALVQPAISTLALVLLIGAFMLADGVLGTWAAISSRKYYDDWWILLLWGLTGIVAGALTFFVPQITALVLMFYIAAWAIAKGVLEIVAAIRLRKEIKGEWMLVLGGLASVAFGVILLAQPAAGALILLWLIASFALVFGVLHVALAFRLRKYGKQFGTPPVRPRMTGTGTRVDPFTPASGQL